MTPLAAYEARDKARPIGPQIDLPKGTRVHRDRIDGCGAVTLRHEGMLHHIGVGRAHKHRKVIMLVADLYIRILSEEGEMLRHLTLFRPGTIRLSGTPMCPRCRDTSVHDVLRHHMAEREGFEPS